MTLYYDENVRNTKRQKLESKALQLVHPAYVTLLEHISSETLEGFKMGLQQALHKREGFASSVRKYTQAYMLEFDRSCAGASVQQANWDASKVREKLHHDIVAHASAVHSAKLAEIVTSYEIIPVKSLFETIGEDTWAFIRELLKRETDAAVSRFSSAISGFELDHSTLNSMVQNLRNYAKSVVEKKCKGEVRRVLIRMKERFSTVFNVQRVWTEKEDIRAIRESARSTSLKLLAVMAAIRLDEKPDKVDDVLFSSLMHGKATTNLLATSSWEEVPPEKTLITPIRCKSLWKEFKAETKDAVTQAAFAQEAYTKKKSDSYLGSKVLSHFVGIVTGAVTGAAAAAAAGVGGMVVGGPVLGAGTGVSGGVSAGVSTGMAVTSAMNDALGVPTDADTEVILKRNRDMLAESD